MKIIKNTRQRTINEGIVITGLKDTQNYTKTSINNDILILTENDFYLKSDGDLMHKLKRMKGFLFDLILIPRSVAHRLRNNDNFLDVILPTVMFEKNRIVLYE